MSDHFPAGCYIIAVFPDGTFDADDTCYVKHADALKHKRRLLGVFPEAEVFIHRVSTAEELAQRRSEATGAEESLGAE